MIKKFSFICIGLAAILAIGAVVIPVMIYFVEKSAPVSLVINSYDDCAKAGYPILETYPEQCKTPDGRTFVRQIVNEPPIIVEGKKSSQYENKDLGFSLWYPAGSEIRTENLEGYLSLAKNGVVGFFLPTEMFAGTNLREAAVIIGVDSAILNCEQVNTANDEKDLGLILIGQVQFHKFSAIGVGAGNIYESTIYRAAQAGRCYEIVELLHSGNIANYPEGAVKEFSQSQFSGILEKIVQAFSFIQ